MEVSAATVVLFLSLISLVILVYLLRRKSSHDSKKNRPPGPQCLPFIGNLLHLVTPQPQVALWDLARKHGPVMYLRLGHVDTVVISSPAAAQEVLRDKDLIFASRPKMLATDIILDGMDLAYAPHSAYWRKLRKLCMTVLLGAHKVRQLAPLRDRETLALIRNVGAAGEGGEPVNLGRLLVHQSEDAVPQAFIAVLKYVERDHSGRYAIRPPEAVRNSHEATDARDTREPISLIQHC
jgi:hypothetical protein